ncbi:jacalin-like lectin [uncultured Shimia sp.]|uniref:jacalin-like lectin n=1 Tax=uncultured Shimia sp. TaxID=573152 RepID=UPI0025F5DF1E|nr:jacalin-like lectin [uncultured Shimia sp.]
METPEYYKDYFREGPVGGDNDKQRDFAIYPPAATGWRIDAIAMNAAWLIDNLMVTYEGIDDENKGETRTFNKNGQTSAKALAAGPTGKHWTVAAVEHLTKITGRHGKATTGDLYGGSENTVVTLRVEGLKDTTGAAGGGGAGFKDTTEPFEFNAPLGFHIVGFFGTLFIKEDHSETVNKLGVLFAPMPQLTEDEKKNILKMRKENKNDEEIAKELNRHLDTIKQVN